MSGLLNLTDDPQTLGLLSLGLRLMSNPSRRFGAALGQSGLGAIGDIQQAQASQEQRKARALQEQLIRQQIEQGGLGLDAARREAELSRLPEQFVRPPMMAGADGTDAGAGMGGGAMDAGKVDLAGLKQAYLGRGEFQRAGAVDSFIPKPVQPKFQEHDPTKHLLQIGPDGPKVLIPGQAKPEGDKPTDDMREFAFAVSRGEVPTGMTFTDWMRANKKAGASQVSVTTGQKGLDNERNLRNDFRSEAAVKAFEEMQTAHKQIKAALAAGTPIGDTAGATKMMKLLDPTSVVRESELGMAMAASGRMDRMKNYLEMQIKGTKLTPTQRVEFGKLADDLMAASGQAYNTKHSEYRDLGGRYKLDTGVLGNPWTPTSAAPPKPGAKPAAAAKPPPAGVDAAVWGAMTPEERALWK